MTSFVGVTGQRKPASIPVGGEEHVEEGDILGGEGGSAALTEKRRL